ncbi:DUF5682 family protein [Streptacidiphilus rugosus]|uniref:DUF5682 family protein n=1 Tax=Streptacidiphilus rugosus TaxID=405783 RepID=UPI00068B63C3|nr:DUF5682 family protein [Streptacidiphilus rugosus]
MTDIALLGVRHHGPGSARAVGAALTQFRPDTVLIEGPPEADALLALAAGKDMAPPVALLAHVVDEPARAAFWPFAAFSPEWVALRHALDREIPVRFIDLPAAHTFALAASCAEESEEREALGVDPIGELARAAGQEDAERWWDDVVEHARPGGGGEDALAPFLALAEAMTALREQAPEVEEDARREAYMRRQIRAAVRAGAERIAVVCGAWHVPALAARVPVAADNALLRGLPKAKVEVTWVPWTHRRLSQHTGYGAGIASPGWYQHLFDADGHQVVERWLTRVAGLLREEDYAVSSAHVIEAVRLAETLAAVRGRPLAGLSETVDAVRAVLCEGSDVPLRLVEDRLIVGDALGQVPDAAPAVPLQRDLSRLQRELRLKPETRVRVLELDLRKELDAARSRFLHRLALLDIDWAVPAESQTRATGTFRESWELAWEPESAVRVAEAGIWGTTVEAAASARVSARAVDAQRLGEVTALAETCLLAALPEALPVVLSCLADRAALDTDVAHLAQALPALVRSLRYGDVRSTATPLLADLATSLATRICIGLPSAASSLDPTAAQALADHLTATHSAISLLATTPTTEPSPPAARVPQASPAAVLPGAGPGAAESAPAAQVRPGRDAWEAVEPEALPDAAAHAPKPSPAAVLPGAGPGAAESAPAAQVRPGRDAWEAVEPEALPDAAAHAPKPSPAAVLPGAGPGAAESAPAERGGLGREAWEGVEPEALPDAAAHAPQASPAAVLPGAGPGAAGGGAGVRERWVGCLRGLVERELAAGW